MNVNDLLAAIPDEATLEALDVAGKKKAVLDAIDAVIRALAAENRNADVWESNMMLRSMAAILRAQYSLAAQDLRLVLTPASQRQPGELLETAESMTPESLKEILSALRRIAAR
ncbi:hypothetical protein [Variovorax boronicumulans]|uniref:hypothetical protein n=1 Tax=Variovorax boronicumulans TaxID=436515 RepID=UPI001C568477